MQMKKKSLKDPIKRKREGCKRKQKIWWGKNSLKDSIKKKKERMQMKTKKAKNSWGGSQFLWSFHPMFFNCTGLLPVLHYRIYSFLMKKQYLCIDIMFSKKKKNSYECKVWPILDDIFFQCRGSDILDFIYKY